MVTILFNNGYEITAELNGKCFITDSKPNFPSDLEEIEITTDKGTYTVAHGEVIECAAIDDRYWFSIHDMPEEVINANNLEAQVFYTATMTDTLME